MQKLRGINDPSVARARSIEKSLGIQDATLRCMAEPTELLRRTYSFALASIKFYKRLPKTPDGQVPGAQYLRASTSAWANYRAARRGRSRPEFIAKLGQATEEADESVGWLELMRDAEIGSDDRLLAEAQELCAIVTASLTTARRNLATKKATF